MGMLATIRRMHLRDGMSLREVSKRTGLSRNTVRSWMRRPQVVEPVYPARKAVSKLDGWTEVLQTWLRTDSHRGKRERRTAKGLFQAVRAQGYAGGYGRVCAFVRRWKAEQVDAPKRAAYVPLTFELGEASSSTGAASTLSLRACAGGWRWRTRSLPRVAPSGLWPTPARATRCSSMRTRVPLPRLAGCRAAASTTT